MATSLNGNIFTQYVDANGAPLVGGKVYFYAQGTTTLQTIYADAGEANTLPNPVTLGDRGQITATIFLNGTYNIVVEDADGVQQFQRDDFTLASTTAETLTNLQALGAVLGSYTEVDALITIADGDIVLGDAYGGLYALKAGGDPSLDPESDDYDENGLGAEWTFLNASARPHGIKGYWATLNTRSTPIQAGDVVIGSTTKGLYELRSGGNSANDPESDTYTAAGVGTDWFDVIKRNQSNAGSTGTGLPDNTLTGCKISNGTVDANHDIDIAAGVATDSTNSEIITVTAITKQIDAGWAAGTNAGGLDTGSVAADTAYAVYVIKKDSDGSSDAIYSANFTSPSMPSGYTVFRRVAAVVTDSSANILKFNQYGDRFVLDVVVSDYDGAGSTSRAQTTLTAPPEMEAYVHAQYQYKSLSGGETFLLLTSDDQADTTPSATAYTAKTTNNAGSFAFDGMADVMIRTNSSREINYRSTDTRNVEILTSGWLDTRGRLD